MTTIKKEVLIEIDWCYACGNPIALTAQWQRACKEEGKTFYCPMGHGQIYRNSEVQVLTKKLAASQELVTRLETRILNSEAMFTVEAKKRQRLEKRVNNGVCIHCNRTFQQLARHMKARHPAP